ncbi:hypothetical protein GCM10009745_63130 [Kribbella yunnanensis]|uniref:Uncharacterized protein n=1 Tax=Kribbella yunnanensis TaxID=190194 RepID=A0ABP4UKX2_9ACTN
MNLDDVAAALERRGVPLTGIGIVAETVDSLLRLAEDVSAAAGADPAAFPLLVMTNKELNGER